MLELPLKFSFRLLFFLGGVVYPVACRILVSWPGIEPMSLVVEAWSLNHWTTREVLQLQVLVCCSVIINRRVLSTFVSKIWKWKREYTLRGFYEEKYPELNKSQTGNYFKHPRHEIFLMLNGWFQANMCSLPSTVQGDRYIYIYIYFPV